VVTVSGTFEFFIGSFFEIGRGCGRARSEAACDRIRAIAAADDQEEGIFGDGGAAADHVEAREDFGPCRTETEDGGQPEKLN
jgi:hypothetical protein